MLKLEWFSLNKDLRQAKNADLDGIVFESDIEEAARLKEEAMTKSLAEIMVQAPGPDPGADEMMVDALEQEQLAEFEELEALAASTPDGPSGELPRWQQQQQRSQKPPDSPYLSDDEDYDELFMTYLSQEQQSQSQAPAPSGEMDLS